MAREGGKSEEGREEGRKGVKGGKGGREEWEESDLNAAPAHKNKRALCYLHTTWWSCQSLPKLTDENRASIGKKSVGSPNTTKYHCN